MHMCQIDFTIAKDYIVCSIAATARRREDGTPVLTLAASLIESTDTLFLATRATVDFVVALSVFFPSRLTTKQLLLFTIKSPTGAIKKPMFFFRHLNGCFLVTFKRLF